MDKLNFDELTRLAEAMGRLAYPSLNLLLIGQLGSGKTTFTKAFAKGLGIDEGLVRSPSFAIMYVYTGRLELIHVDLYRLDGPHEIFYAGIYDVFDPDDGVLVVEWADRLGEDLPDRWVKISFFVEDSEHRRLVFECNGEREEAYLRKAMEVFGLAEEVGETGRTREEE